MTEGNCGGYRGVLLHQQVELEAESVAYLVCARNGVKSASETYLRNFVQENTTISDLDVYQVMRAAGQVETLLGLGRRSKFQEEKGNTLKAKTDGMHEL